MEKINEFTYVNPDNIESLKIINNKYYVAFLDGSKLAISEDVYNNLLNASTSNGSSNENNESKKPIQTTNITYTELKALVDNAQLIPDTYYRITDFVTTVPSDHNITISAGHAFDVIVKAIDASTLDENAKAALHEGDTYFAESEIDKWEIKYTIENDFFSDENGKGSIVYMKDQFNNECYYDFKNVQWKRYQLIGAEANSIGIITYLIYNAETNPIYYGTPDKYDDPIAYYDLEFGEFKYCYTFNNIIDDSDASLKIKYKESGDEKYYPHDNKISNRRGVNNVVFYHDVDHNNYRTDNNDFSKDGIFDVTFGPNTFDNKSNIEIEGCIFGIGTYENTLGDEESWSSIVYNLISGGFNNNVIGEEFQENVIGAYFYDNVIGENFSANYIGNNTGYNIGHALFTYNKIGNDFSSNNIANNFSNNVVGNYFEDNELGTDCYCNIFGDDFTYNETITQSNGYSGLQNNVFGDECDSNTFGSSCRGIVFGNRCEDNTFTDYTQNVTLGDDCRYNKFVNTYRLIVLGDNCEGNTFGKYSGYITLGDECEDNTFGENCDDIVFGNRCHYNILPDNVRGNVRFGDNVRYITVVDGTPDVNGYITKFVIEDFTRPSSTYELTIPRNYETMHKFVYDTNANVIYDVADRELSEINNLKKLAVKFGCADAVENVEGQTFAEVIDFMQENYQEKHLYEYCFEVDGLVVDDIFGRFDFKFYTDELIPDTLDGFIDYFKGKNSYRYVATGMYDGKSVYRVETYHDVLGKPMVIDVYFYNVADETIDDVYLDEYDPSCIYISLDRQIF